MSVHLQNYPNISDKISSKSVDVAKEMNLAKIICNLGLSIRKEKEIKVRMPLSKLYILLDESMKMRDSIIEVVKSELNIKGIEFLNTKNDIFEVETGVLVNFKTCGAKFGKDLKKISENAKAGQYLKTENGVSIDGFELEEKTDFSFFKRVKNIKDNFAFSSTDGVVCVIDCSINEELRLECLARDFVRFIQDTRKAMNLNIMDKINITIQNDTKMEECVSVFGEYITSQTLSKITFNNVSGNVFENDFTQSLKVDISVC